MFKKKDYNVWNANNNINKTNAIKRFYNKHNHTIDMIFVSINISLIWLSIIIYNKSLVPCLKSNLECLYFFLDNYNKILYNIKLFSIIMFFNIIISYFKNFYIITIINFIIIFILYINDYSFNLINHGFFSIWISSFIFINFFTLFFILCIFVVCFKKNKIKTLIISALIIMLTLIILYLKVKWDVEKFYIGFNNEHLLNEGKLCKYQKFKLNYYETFKNINFLSKYLNSPYFHSIDFLNKICSNCVYFSYPQPKEIPEEKLFYINTFKEFSIKLIKGYKKKEDMESDNDREIFLKIDRKNNSGIIFYNPKIDEKIFNLKRKVINNSENKKYNVISIFIDALSRQQFFRIFPKTREFISKHYFDEDSNEKVGQGYQFFRAHSIKPWTADNWWAYRYGSWVLSNERFSLNDLYRKNGYETANLFNSCAFFENFTFYYKNRKKVYYPNSTFYDHDSSAFFCDPNFYMNDYYNAYIGQYSIFKKKLYGKRPYDYNFEFSKIWMDKLRKLNKFQKNKVPFMQDLYFVDAHEYTQNVIQDMDNSFNNYLKYLKENNYLKDTLINIFSDHGNHMNKFASKISGAIERSSPLLLVLMNKELSKKHHKVIKQNEQKLITLGDLHKALYQIQEKDNKSIYFYKDWFKEVIPENRTCKEAHVSEDFCFCK